MPIHTAAEQLINDIIHDRAHQYAHDVQQFQARKATLDKAGEAHEKKQIEFMTSLGLKPAALQASLKQDEKALDAYLAEYRPALVSRAGSPAANGKSASLFASQLPPTTIIVPPYGVFAPPFPPPPPEVTSGWIFTDAGNLKIEADYTGSGTGWWATAGPPPVPHDVIFTFIPAETTTYDLTAIFAFHGFYVLVADDGFFTHKSAEVTMDVAMSANQYVDLEWKTFPRPIDASGDNINEFVSYDRTIFFDYSAPLRAGDPVVVTARITLNAAASGSGSHAEINFKDGTANYIMPLFLSVGPA
jgi:hypothetical protein